MADQDDDRIKQAHDNYEKYQGKRPEDATEDERHEEFERLMGVVRNKGFKPGWAAYKFKELFGDWPPREWKDEAPSGGKAPAGLTHCPHCGKSLAEASGSPPSVASEGDEPPPLSDEDLPF